MGFLDMKAEIGDLGWEAAGASDSPAMILTCPECATSYFVDDSRIEAAGRTVKCSNCGARWRALPQGAETEAVAAVVAGPRPPPMPAIDDLVIAPRVGEIPYPPKRTPAPRREAKGKVLIWVASAIVAAGLIVSAIVFRAEVVKLVPASQAAYAGLGLEVSSLAIEQVHAEPAFQGGRPVLSVTGQIRNLRDTPANSPPLRVSVLDRLGHPVVTKIARPIEAAVPAHAVRHFAISIVDPPAGVHDLEVSFEPAMKGARPPVSVPVVAPAEPQPAEAKPLPPGSPDALPTPR